MIKTTERVDTKPTPIVPQVWQCVYFIDPNIMPGPALVRVGPDEYLDTGNNFPTEEIADENGLAAMHHCLSCWLKCIFGHIGYLRAERIE